MNLLSPIDLGGLKLPNRVFMAPLTRLRAQQPGAVPHALNALYYSQRATAGLIIAEATAISPSAQGYYGAPGIFSDDQVAGWRQVVEAVHAKGGRITLQLWHVGAISHPEFQPDGQAPVAPSQFNPGGEAITAKGKLPRVPSRALEKSEIKDILIDYEQATTRARAAGFDGVEVHAANGYLINQFLLEGTNQRNDEYGGSIPNRIRFLQEVVRNVVNAWEPQKVGVRLSPGTSGGPFQDRDRFNLYRQAVSSFKNLPLAYLHFVEPGTESNPTAQESIASYQFRQYMHPDTRLISSSGHTRESGEMLLRENKADAIAYGRLFISNPDLVERFRQDAPLNPYNTETFYGGATEGYTDYPFLGETELA